MNDIRAVIFDRDGVLADFDYRGAQEFFIDLPVSIEELGRRWQNWGEFHGFPSTLDQESEFFEGFWNNLGDELQIPTGVLDRYRGFNYAEYLTLFPDAEKILTWLKEKSIKVGVLTNFTLASVDMSLKTLGIWDYVAVACGATIIGVAKPDPMAYSIVLEKLNVDPGTTLFFDDEARHVNGARNAGILNAFYVNRSAQDHNLPKREVKDLFIVQEIVEKIRF